MVKLKVSEHTRLWQFAISVMRQENIFNTQYGKCIATYSVVSFQVIYHVNSLLIVLIKTRP